MVAAAVCQPLAARPLKKVGAAVASSRWKGWGSNSTAKALIASAVIVRRAAPVKTCPSWKSSR